MSYLKVLIALIVLYNVKANSQIDTIKNGAYRTSIDFNRNSPLIEAQFNFEKIKNRKIPELFKVSSLNNESNHTLYKV